MEENATREFFGAAVRLARIRAGVTQEQLAERIGVERRTVMRIENGITEAMLSTATRIAAALGANLNEMAGGGRRESFETGRRIFLNAAAKLLEEYGNSEDPDLGAVLANIRCGIENDGVLAWLDKAAALPEASELERVAAFAALAGDSPEIFGRIGAASIVRHEREYDIARENERLARHARIRMPEFAKEGTVRALMASSSHAERDREVAQAIERMAIDRGEHWNSVRRQLLDTWKGILKESIRVRTEWIIQAIAFAG